MIIEDDTVYGVDTQRDLWYATPNSFLTGLSKPINGLVINAGPRGKTGRFWMKNNGGSNTETFTTRIDGWMKENNITYPFDDESRLLFELTWG